MLEPALRDKYFAEGLDLKPGTPEQFAEFMRAEASKRGRVAEVARIGAKWPTCRRVRLSAGLPHF